MQDTIYCDLCGNVQVPYVKDAEYRHCPDCDAVVHGPLAKAWEMFNEAVDRYGHCCSGLSATKDHLHLHADGFESSYPPAASDDEPQACTEAFIQFYGDHAATTYTFDADTFVESFGYGENIPYADPAFWDRLDVQLGQAAQAAWNNDVLTCAECGYNYNSWFGGCPSCSDDALGDDEEDGDE